MRRHFYSRLNAYWGNGTGTFEPATTLYVGGQPGEVVYGDFNEDGLPDAVVTNLKTSTRLMLMGPNRSFGTSVTILAVDAWQPAVGDINRDGHLDLVAPEANRGNLIVRLGDGKGGLSVPTTKPPALSRVLYSVAIADFDGDGLPDLAVGNGVDKDVSFLRGEGTGLFGPPMHVKTAWIPIDLGTGDLDHDGLVDLVVSEWDQGLTVFFGPCP